MRKLKLFLTLLMLMCIGVTQMWGADVETTYTFTSASWGAKIGDVDANWTSGAAGNAFTPGQGVQVTTGKSGANATSPKSFTDVKQVIVTYNTNASKGAGAIKIKVGDNTEVSNNVAYTSGTGTSANYTTIFNFSPYQSGSIKLTCTCTTNSIWPKSITIVEASSTPSYTITPASNNTSYGTVSIEGSVITGHPANGYRYASPAYTVTEGTATVSQNGDEFTVTPESDCTVRINFEIIPTHKISFNTGGLVEIADATEIQEGASYNITQTPAGSITDICEYKTFVGWTRSSSITNPSVSPAIEGASIQMGNGDITLNAVYSKTEGGSSPINDVLNNALTGISGTNYGNWSSKTSNSDAVYAGNSAGGNESIQLRSNNSNSGIVTTTSGGKATKVTVEWNSNTAATRTITIYGKNSAYSAATDLYGSNAGTSLGELNIDNATNNISELTITGDYEYIGIRSKSGALYLNSVTITWGSSGSISYSMNPNCVVPECSNPNIGTQPVSAEYAKDASPVTALFVEATAATGTLTYQWYSNTTASNEGGEAIDGATNASYTPAVDVAGIFYYYCVVGIKDDVCKTASNVATITVKEDPTITPTDGNVEVGKTLDVSTLFSSNSVGAITYSITAGDAATIEGNTLSAVKAGSVTVQASQEANGCYNAKTATATVTVTAPLPKITITADDLEDFAASYDDYAWSINGVQGIVGAYKSGGMQFNPTKAGYYAYNTTAIPGNITKIAMTKASGSTRPWTPYVSDEAMTTADANKALEAKAVEGTVEWNVTGSNQYFYLQVSGGATVISSIVITYEPIYSAVTLNNEAIENGSVGVTGADDLTAVAAGTVLTLTNDPDDNFQLVDYNVYKTGEPATKITVTDGKFTMPLYDVTVSASFEAEKSLDHLVITTPATQTTFWVGEDFNYDGLAIKAVYDNSTEKENVTPNSVSTPDMSEAGVKTVTIAYQEKEIEKTTSYEITVKALPTDPTKPCTVVEALDYLDKFDDLEKAYVTGKVSEITEEFSSYGNISYNISDDGETSSPQLLVYRGKDFDGENFPNADAIQIGDSVVVAGKIFTYEKTNTKEFAQNNQIVYRPKKVVSIALSEGYKTAFNDNEEFSHEGVVVTATYNYGDDEPVSATWSEPVMTQIGEQEVTVSYTYEGKTVEFKYTITITHVCAPENLVAVTKGEEVNGAYSLSAEEVCTEGDGATVDVTDIIPAEGYRFKEITATAGTVDNDLKKVTGIKAATTITVVFQQIPSYDVTWNVNGETSTTKVQEGSKPTFPNTPESCDATSTAFYGWATAPWTGKAENLNEKTVYTSAADMPEVMAAGTIYYAVFAKATAGDPVPMTLWSEDFSSYNADDVPEGGSPISYSVTNGGGTTKVYTTQLGAGGDSPELLVAKSNGTFTASGIATNGVSSATLTYHTNQTSNLTVTTTAEHVTIGSVSVDGTDTKLCTRTITFADGAPETFDLTFTMTTGSNSRLDDIVLSAELSSVSYSEFLTTCCTKYNVNIANGIEHGSVTADLAKACEGATVTLTPAADPAYHFDAWSVSYNDGENDHPVTVTENKFTMPAFDVTVSATFEHDECTQLGTPANVEAVANYKSAMLDWDDVENADHYVVTIKKGVETVESNIVDESEYEVVATLLAKTTYTYEIQATADDAQTHCPSALASADFETEPLPTAHLILSENGEEFEFEENQHKLNDVVTLPSELHYSGCTGKVLKGWSKAAVAEQDEEPTENYWAAGAEFPLTATSQTLYAVYATAGEGAASTLFSETFNDCVGTGGNDGSWSGSIASSTLTADNTGWTFNNGSGAKQCAKFGTSSKKGSAETPAISITGSATLTFKAGAWNGGSEGTTLNLSATGATLDKSSVEMTKGAWTSYTVAITNANGSVKIKFEAKNASNNRFFLDDVVVSQSAISYSAYTTSCDAALEVPTFNIAGGEFATAQTITLSAVEDATIYYTTDGSNPTTDDVYSAPIVLDACGTTTIKAFAKKDAQESEIVSETYIINLPITNTAENAYTPAEAIAIVDGACDKSEAVFVKGVVTSASLNSTLTNNSAQYNGSYNVYVKEAETDGSVTFEFFRMWKDGEGTAFAEGDITVGDTLIATGTLTKFTNNNTQVTTYEFNAGCYMVDRKAFVAEKEHIANTQETAYTVAQAIGYCNDAITYDLNDEVYVKGVAIAAPNNAGTFNIHDANVENTFRIYKSVLSEELTAAGVEIAANDTVIAKGKILLYNNTTPEMDEGCVVVEVKKYVAHTIAVNPTAVAFGEVEQNATAVDAIDLNVYLTNVANATVTLTDENNVFSINQATLTENGVVVVSVTNTNVEVGPYAATITIHDKAEVAADKVVNVTMTIIKGDTRNKAQDLDGFEALNGNLNADIAFASTKGDGTSDPILSEGKILYYQPNSGKAAGGYMTLTAVKGCKIDQVKVVTANHDTKIKYSKDGEELSDATDVTAGAIYLTPADLEAQTVNIYCAGADKNHRLYVSQVVVYYTGEATPLHHRSVDASAVVTTEFPKNGTFSSEGLVVYACYDANCEDYVDITDQCNVVADLTSIGEKKAEVYLGEEKLGEYDITVVAGQEDPALAYTPASETIPAAGIGGWVAPTLNNPFNVTPSYNTNNAAVATVDESGVIALAGGYGKAVITASFAETEDYIASVATYTITVQEPANKIAGEWHKVTSTADITVGSKVIIANIAEGTDVKTMGAVSDNGKYRLEVASTVDNDGILSAEDGTKTFTLVDAGNGLYAFKGNNGKYLSAASSSSNDMKEVATVDANASWSISIEEGVATILAQGSYSRNWLRYNQTNTRFSCYASGQQDIALYVNRKEYVAPAVDPENPTPATPVAINTNVEEEEIVASGNVVVTVNTDNFEEPKSYIAQNGATIVINGNGAEEAKSVIADEQSKIQVNQQTTVNQVFSVAATMGAGLSGQITGVDNVTIAESTEAYFDITLGDNANPNKWHAIAVPFPVDAISGIYDAETGAKLNNEEHYAIMDYHGDIRATGAYGWKKYRSIMQPGVFYLMTVDGNTKTFRFKMSGVTLPTATSLALQLFAASGDGQSADAGWNGVANPTLKHGTVNQTVLVLNPTSYTYEDHDAGSYNFVVGTPFFIQANAAAVATGMQMGAVDENKPYYAPKRVSENGFENIKVFFGNDEYKDKLTISANVEALNEYQIGKDLVKMTMTNTPSVAQIFGNAYNAKLCRVYAPMANDQAEYSLTLYAPNAGEYTISAPEMEDADIFLTYEGSIIWNLSMSEYTNDFAKGNNEGYGLILVKKAPQVITGVDNAEANEAGVQKVIINDHVYILRAEQMYDVTGKMVK